MISKLVTDSAPWRKDVPMQSEPVSPPPMTTTCLPLARIGCAGQRLLAADPPVLLRQEIHRKVDASKFAAGHRQVARLFGTAGEHQRVIFAEQLVGRDVDADMSAVMEGDAFRLHLRDAAVDVIFLHFEIGNAVAQKPAGLGPPLIDVDLMTGASELLRASEAGRTGADDRNLLAGSLRRRFGLETLRDGAVGYGALDRFDRNGILVDVERARGFARRRADAAGHFREIIGGVEVARRLVPVAVVDEVVPVRDLVVDRTARRAGRYRPGALAIGHAAIHAARGLGDVVLLRQRQHEFAPVANALSDRFVVAVLALVFEKAGDLTHLTL